MLRTYFCMIVTDRLPTMVENLERAWPHFDEVIVVDGGSTDGTLEWLSAHPEIHTIHFPWCDDFAASRNQYLAKIGELRRPEELSVYCRSDDDEFYSDVVLRNVGKSMEAAAIAGYNQICLRCRDITLDKNGEVVEKQLTDFYKPLLHFWEPGMHYVKPVHEALITPSGANQVYLEDQEGSWVYEHRKRQGVVWERAVRNFFIGEGFHTSPENRRIWSEFHEVIGPFPTYREFMEYLKKGNVSQELKDFLVKYKDYGLPSNEPCFTEIRELYLTYFELYHPEERA